MTMPAVMGTGIVSIGLALDHREALSRVLLVVAVATWTVLAAGLGRRVLADREAVRRAARSPAALTAVAGTSVIGARLTLLGWDHWGAALLVVALALWLVLLWPVLRGLETPTRGVSLMLTVATESLAVLAAAVAQRERAPWLLHAALAPFALGLVFYVVVIVWFDRGQLKTGRGDHWITGGALAISTLAMSRIALAATALRTLSGAHDAFRVTALVLWCATMAWLPALLGAEALHRRPGYDVRRWSTVFPVGMYATCSFLAGRAASASGITEFARVWVWAGLAVWLLVAGTAIASSADR